MPSRLHPIIAFTVKGRHAERASRDRLPQIVYRAVYVDWKLQNNREKRSISGTRAF